MTSRGDDDDDVDGGKKVSCEQSRDRIAKVL